jgi:hypothetical protein
MPKKGLLGGGKCGKSHSTLIDDAEVVVRHTKKMDAVSKIVLSVIKPVRVGKRRIKIVRIPAGLRIAVRGVSAVQKLFIYTDDPDTVSEALMRIWDKRVDE